MLFLISSNELNLYFSLSPLSGDVDSAVEVLEAVFTSPDSTNPSISFVFRKVLEDDNDKALDKCKTHTHAIGAYMWTERNGNIIYKNHEQNDTKKNAIQA